MSNSAKGNKITFNEQKFQNHDDLKEKEKRKQRCIHIPEQ